MTRTALEAATDAWSSTYEGLTQEETDRRVLAFTALIRGIAASGAVTRDAFSHENQLDATRTNELFANLAAMGLEFDDAGKIVGAALTTRPTPHSLVVGGKQLFAWCALDTLFIPGLLGETAEVESACPVSRTRIQLTVTPEGVSTVNPPEAALSVVLPGVGSAETTTGPASPT